MGSIHRGTDVAKRRGRRRIGTRPPARRTSRDARGPGTRELVDGGAERLDHQLRSEGIPRQLHARGPVIDVAFTVEGGSRRYFSTVTTLGTPSDITLEEIRIELFHPATAD